jgi:hypothetical protein
MPITTVPDDTTTTLTASKPADSNQPSRPDYIPEKFWKEGKPDIESLARSYAELERKQSQPPDPNTTPNDDNKGDQTPTALDPFFKEFETTGALSDDSLSSLEKLGYPRAVVEQYIKGHQASQELAKTQATAFESSVHAAVGGKAAFDSMSEWARRSLTDAELASYNKAVNTNDPETAKLAVLGLYQLYTKATGKPAGFLEAATTSQGQAPYESWDQLVRAQADPRYTTDEAYRAKVTQRLAASTFWRK